MSKAGPPLRPPGVAHATAIAGPGSIEPRPLRKCSTDASMTLAANSVAGGTTLSGYQCFTLDEGLFAFARRGIATLR
jgi:hypothetical protein